jgi:hypothetical protein
MAAALYTYARIRLLSSREHDMRCVLRGLVLRHRESQRGQVNIDKQRLTLTEGNWCKCKVEGIESCLDCEFPNVGDGFDPHRPYQSSR